MAGMPIRRARRLAAASEEVARARSRREVGWIEVGGTLLLGLLQVLLLTALVLLRTSLLVWDAFADRRRGTSPF